MENFYEIKECCTYISVRVNTKSSKNSLHSARNNQLLISTTTVPENGKANEAVIKILSKFLKIPKSKFTIVSGEKNRNKIIKISCVVSEEEIKKYI